MADAGPVLGVEVDGRTGCAHYRSALDIVALRLPCCGRWYACRECHDALAGHPAEVWPAARSGERAVLCGACRAELTVEEYLASGHRCPRCGAGFNPRCAGHRHLYFAEPVA